MIRVRYSPLMMRSNRTPFHKSKKIVAIAIGVLVGCLLALTYPFFPKLNPSRFIPFQLMFQTCEPSDQVDPLISEFQTLTTNNHELELQIKQLNKKIKLAEQAKDQAHTQAKLLGETHKAGTFGTVKGLRTNPTIAPDKRVNPTLAKLLKKIAVEQELIVTLANANVKTTLEVWFTSINRVGITNYLVISLDDETALFCKSKNVPYYRKVDSNKGADSIGKNGTNHSISGLKFRILREFLQLGYNILLSDVDIVYLQDPFDHLYRDSDVESMSDGHSNSTAYGFNDVFDEPAMGWARYAHTMRIWVYNSGFFYIRPTIPAIELLDRVAKRLETEEAWDQAVFNEELFYPSHPGYDGLYASRRTMDMYQFMNSKVLFKTVRKSTELIRKVKPVVVHVNYHVNKLERMKAVVEFYVNGKHDALNSFPDGSR